MDTRDKYKNARAFIVLAAALITWLLNLKYKRGLLNSLIILLIVIIVFYIIATIALRLIDKIRNMETVKSVELEETQPEKEKDVQNDTQ